MSRDVVERMRGFVKAWLSIRLNYEVIHGINGDEITTDDLTEAADELTRLCKREAELVEALELSCNRWQVPIIDAIASGDEGLKVQYQDWRDEARKALKEPKQ